jgi:hypothetical protein
MIILITIGVLSLSVYSIRLIHLVEKRNAQIKLLWSLLDDIDTIDDIAKGSNEVYRELVNGIPEKRFQVATSDGYKIKIK